MKTVVLVVLTLTIVDLLLFSGIIIKRVLRNTYRTHRDERKGWYLRKIKNSVATRSSFWSGISMKEMEQRDQDIERALIQALEAGSTSTEKQDIIDIFMDPRCYMSYLVNLRHPKPLVRARAAQTLGRFQTARAVKPLITALNDPDTIVRSVAARALGKIATDRAARALCDQLKLTNHWHAQRLVAIIEEMGAVSGPHLVALLETGPEQIKPFVAQALGVVGDHQAVKSLIRTLQSPDSDLRAKAAEALGKLGHPDAIFHLCRLSSDYAWPVRTMAATALGSFPTQPAVKALSVAIKDKHWWVRRRAADSLSQMGTVGEKALIDTLQCEDRYAREKAGEALELGGAIEKYTHQLVSSDARKAREAQMMLRSMLAIGCETRIIDLAHNASDIRLKRRLKRLLREEKQLPNQAANRSPSSHKKRTQVDELGSIVAVW